MSPLRRNPRRACKKPVTTEEPSSASSSDFEQTQPVRAKRASNLVATKKRPTKQASKKTPSPSSAARTRARKYAATLRSRDDEGDDDDNNNKNSNGEKDDEGSDDNGDQRDGNHDRDDNDGDFEPQPTKRHASVRRRTPVAKPPRTPSGSSESGEEQGDDDNTDEMYKQPLADASDGDGDDDGDDYKDGDYKDDKDDNGIADEDAIAPSASGSAVQSRGVKRKAVATKQAAKRPRKALASSSSSASKSKSGGKSTATVTGAREPSMEADAEVASMLSDVQHRQLDKVFGEMDRNKNGRLTVSDLLRVADEHAVACSAEEAENMVRFWDCSGTQTVSRASFARIAVESKFVNVADGE